MGIEGGMGVRRRRRRRTRSGADKFLYVISSSHAAVSCKQCGWIVHDAITTLLLAHRLKQIIRC